MTEQSASTVLIKAHCERCSHYHRCPRMRGKNICYGKKEVLLIAPEKKSHLRDQTKSQGVNRDGSES